MNLTAFLTASHPSQIVKNIFKNYKTVYNVCCFHISCNVYSCAVDISDVR